MEKPQEKRSYVSVTILRFAVALVSISLVFSVAINITLFSSNSSYQDQINSLLQENTGYLNQIGNLQNQITALEQETSYQNLKSLMATLNTLNTTVHNDQTTINSLQANNVTLSNNITNLKSQISTLEQQVASLQVKLNYDYVISTGRVTLQNTLGTVPSELVFATTQFTVSAHLESGRYSVILPNHMNYTVTVYYFIGGIQRTCDPPPDYSLNTSNSTTNRDFTC